MILVLSSQFIWAQRLSDLPKISWTLNTAWRFWFTKSRRATRPAEPRVPRVPGPCRVTCWVQRHTGKNRACAADGVPREGGRRGRGETRPRMEVSGSGRPCREAGAPMCLASRFLFFFFKNLCVQMDIFIIVKNRETTDFNCGRCLQDNKYTR